MVHNSFKTKNSQGMELEDEIKNVFQSFIDVATVKSSKEMGKPDNFPDWDLWLELNKLIDTIECKNETHHDRNLCLETHRREPRSVPVMIGNRTVNLNNNDYTRWNSGLLVSCSTLGIHALNDLKEIAIYDMECMKTVLNARRKNVRGLEFMVFHDAFQDSRPTTGGYIANARMLQGLKTVGMGGAPLKNNWFQLTTLAQLPNCGLFKGNGWK